MSTSLECWYDHTKERLCQPRKIAILGASGAVCPRFYLPALDSIIGQYPNLRFIPVSRDPEQASPRYLAIPMAECGWVSLDAFQKGEVQADAAIIATPTCSHLTLARDYLETQKGLVMIEKPICMPGELGELVHLLNFSRYSTRERIFAADFFMDSPAFKAALGWIYNNTSDSNPIAKITGRLVENWPIEYGREWLTDPDINGGGLGMDVLPHVIALVRTILDKVHIGDSMVVKESFLARYTNDGQPAEGKGETYMWLKASARGIPIIMDGGKGTGDHYYGVTVHYKNGDSIEIFTGMDGSDGCDPYVKLSKRGKALTYVFPGAGVGYGDILRDFISIVYDTENPQAFYSLNERLRAAMTGVQVVANAYAKSDGSLISHSLGTTPKTPQQIASRADSNVQKNMISDLRIV